MSILALAADTQIAWMGSLVIGAIVALVVLGLLEWLRRTVNRIDEGVMAVWTMGKRVAQNTQNTHVLETTKARGAELLAELEQHRASGERSER